MAAKLARDNVICTGADVDGGASSAPQASKEHLLHPVQGKRATDPRELLRADVQIAPANAHQNEESS